MNLESFIEITGHQEIAHAPDWEEKVNQIFLDFPDGSKSSVLPVHFMKATYPKIGAKIIESSRGESKYWGLLMPHYEGSKFSWVLRDYWKNTPDESKTTLSNSLEKTFALQGIEDVSHYDVERKSKEEYGSTVLKHLTTGIELCSPDSVMALQAKDLQAQVWNVQDPSFLYPSDLYHPESGLPTKLVANHNNEVIGFLLGFHGVGIQWYGREKGFQNGSWIESQLMGINSNYRNIGVATQLKLQQRESAISDNIEVVHWTVDPLQIGNAYLNFNVLGGVAVRHYKDYYVFRNNLNRVSASRIGINWLLKSERVSGCANGERQSDDFHKLVRSSATEVINPLNSGNAEDTLFNFSNWHPTGDILLMEIPKDWNSVQNSDISLAEKWRSQTDDIFSKVLDESIQAYAITGITADEDDNDRPYLIIKKINEGLGI